MQILTIKGRLPGRNEAEHAARSHWSKAAKLKKEYTELVAWECKAQHIKPVAGRARVKLRFTKKT